MPMKELKSYYGNGLNYENINFSDYFRTLSAEAKRQGMLSDKYFTDMKKKMGELLAEKIGDFTGNESTSVMNETANDLFVSLLYTLDMGLFTFSSHEDALDFISENDIFSVYKLGQDTVKQCIFECISLLVKAKSGRINYPDRRYNKLLDSDVMAFLKKYDRRFFSHFSGMGFSYRTVNGCGGYRGILYMKRYLEDIIFENSFVNRFGEESVQELCYGYCERNGLDYNDMGVNIYSLVLTNRLFVVMSDGEGLSVSKESAVRLSKLLKKLPEPEQKRMIISYADKIDPSPYVHKSLVKLAGHIVRAINDNELNRVVYTGEI